MNTRLAAVALAGLVIAQVPASICETCMKKCTTHGAGYHETQSYGSATYEWYTTGVSGARKCGGFGWYCSGDSATVICEYRDQYVTNAFGVRTGPFPDNTYINPCH